MGVNYYVVQILRRFPRDGNLVRCDLILYADSEIVIMLSLSFIR